MLPQARAAEPTRQHPSDRPMRYIDMLFPVELCIIAWSIYFIQQRSMEGDVA